MKTENIILMQSARESLNNKWGIAIGAFLIVNFLIYMVIQLSPINIYVGPIIALILSGPLTLGLAIIFLSISRNQETKLELIFQGFNNFKTAISAYLLIVLFIFLWTLLFIIPGIIAAISYSMTFYIIADDNTISAQDAIKKSKIIMNGYEWKFFHLGLKFFGWVLLSILTLGIGFIWLIPYMQVSKAKFYDDIKDSSF